MSGEKQDRRFVQENGTESRVARIVEPILEELGFRLVRVKLSSLNGQTLQIMCERHDGTMSVEDCEEVSHAVSPVLDIEDPIGGAYHLEISSPGVDRPLVRTIDFENWAGHDARLEFRQLVDGRRRMRGTISKVEDGHLLLETPDAGDSKTGCVRIAFTDIAQARLIISEALIREALKRDKALRKANQGAELDPDDGRNLN